jgi:mono/diheme cytochrome c family protein
MRVCTILTAAVVLTFIPGKSGSTRQSTAPKDLPFQVRSLFLAKCSECHGRGLRRPRAGLYLDDLKALVARRDLVVP